MDENKRIVEINGIKIEVDLRTAKRVDTYKVGDTVKILKKEYGDSYKTYPGVIVGFDEFNLLPTICVAYVNEGYSEVKIEFAFINSASKDIEVTCAQPFEKQFSFLKAKDTFDMAISKKQKELEEIEEKKKWFVDNYNSYFSPKEIE